MRTARLPAALAAAACVTATAPAAPAAPDEVSPVDWVNTYIGTGGGGSDYGGTMPFVTTPFGMTNWTAQTRQNRISVTSYAYEDDTISGFIGTHQPAIWMGDYGYVTLMPEIGPMQTERRVAAPARSRRARRNRRRPTTIRSRWATQRRAAHHRRDDRHRSLRLPAIHLSSGNARPAILIEATRAGVEASSRSTRTATRSSATTPTAWTRT